MPEHVSANVPGILGYMRFMQQSHERYAGAFNLGKV